jgi:hypothetical protein
MLSDSTAHVLSESYADQNKQMNYSFFVMQFSINNRDRHL